MRIHPANEAVLRGCGSLSAAALRRMERGRAAARRRRLTLDAGVVAAERDRLLA